MNTVFTTEAWQGIASVPPDGVGQRRVAVPCLFAEAIRLAEPLRRWCNNAMSAAGDARKEAAEPTTLERDRVDIRSSLAGDGEAYRRLVTRYQQRLGDYLWRFTRNRREWEELVQDVFVEAFFSLSSYSGKAPLEHWLKRIATRIGYRFWKEQYRSRELHELVEADLPAAEDATISAADAAELVHRLLGELRPRDRLVLTLSSLEEKSVVEVAELTGWSKSLVKVQLHRARKRLAKLCEERGIEP